MEPGSIFAGFEQYLFSDDETVQSAFSSGLIVLDTNVILNLYKMDATARNAWLAVLEKLADRLWISHQAIVEFWRNRATAAVHPQVAYQTLNKLRGAQKTIVEEYSKWQSSRGIAEGADNPLDALETALDRLTGDIDGFIKERVSHFSADPAQDELVRRLGPILDGRVGAPYDAHQLNAVYQEADERFASKIPPGYMDDGNNPDTAVGKNTDKKYGDYVLWRQTLEHARTTFHQRDDYPVLLLVTADFKEDWWRKVDVSTVEGSASRSSHTRAARYELITEARETAGATLVLRSPSEFLRLAASGVGVDVSQGIIDSTDAASLSEEQSDTDPPAGVVPDRLFVYFDKAEMAEGHDDEEGFRVISGHTRAEATSTTPPGVVRLRQRLLEQGVFVEADAGMWRLTTPYVFSSASAAATVMLARNSNGLTEWRNSQGVTLKELRSQLDMQ
jgi:hypothetical protein